MHHEHKEIMPVWGEYVLVVVFLAALAVPGIMVAAGWSVPTSNTENRRLAELPEFAVKTFYTAPFRRSFESYLNDHFGFRNVLVGWHLRMYVKWFKTVPIRGVAVHQTATDQAPTIPTAETPTLPDADEVVQPATNTSQTNTAQPEPQPETLPREHVTIETNAILGKDGWYFYSAGTTIDDYRATQPLSDAELKTIADNIIKTKDDLAAQGIAFYVMAAPDKHTIYGEYMPDIYNRVGPLTRLDQTIQYLEQHTDITIIDPRADLLAAKPASRLYEKTGTHWNEYGAYIGYRALLRAIQKDFPAISIPSIEDFTIKTQIAGGADLAIMLSLQEDLQEEQIKLIPKAPRQAVNASFAFENPNPDPEKSVLAKEITASDLPRLLMFRDSFTNAMAPFISENFSRSVFIRNYPIDQTIVEIEQPDVVVLEFVERQLYDALYIGLK